MTHPRDLPIPAHDGRERTADEYVAEVADYAASLPAYYRTENPTLHRALAAATDAWLAQRTTGEQRKRWCGRRSAYPTTDESRDNGAMARYPQSTYGTGGTAR